MNYTAVWTTEKMDGVFADIILDTEKKTILAFDDECRKETGEDYVYLDYTKEEYDEILNEAIQFL